MSPDGRFVAFVSRATTLVTGDTNRSEDAFIHDRMTGTTERASVSSLSAESTGGVIGVAVSDDGRFVAFAASAANLVPNDTNGVPDVFVRDRQMGTTERVSIVPDGSQFGNPAYEPTISGDGRYVTFLVDGDGSASSPTSAYVRDTVAGTTTAIGFPLGQYWERSEAAVVSGDGEFFVFRVSPGNDTRYDVYRQRRDTGAIEMVTPLAGDNMFFLGVSGDESILAFTSSADFFPNPNDPNHYPALYFWSAQRGLHLVTADANGFPIQGYNGSPKATRDGRYVVYRSNSDSLIAFSTCQ
jgi:Tol biopolymer transport system component